MGPSIKELLYESVQYLKANGVENSILDAQLILCHVLNKDRLYLTVHGHEALNGDMVIECRQLLRQRAQGMPVQYMTGLQEFMSLPFKVTQDVLIPRADTEVLVEYVLNQYQDSDNARPLLGMDIGTGSGCIAVSLAYYIKDITVWAVDISGEALAVAKENAALNDVGDNVRFIHQDILQGIPEVRHERLLDVIISNPPYIPTGVIDTLQTEVRDYEPHHALDGGADGFRFYPAIIRQAARHLKPGGLLALEVGHDQSGDIANLIKKSGRYERIEIVKDLAGINRGICARKMHN